MPMNWVLALKSIHGSWPEVINALIHRFSTRIVLKGKPDVVTRAIRRPDKKHKLEV